jgi:hypothetical protein
MVTEKFKSLDEVLSYRNEDVIYALLDKFDITYEESEDLIKECYKWLWLCAKAQNEGFGMLHINTDLRMLDQAWHTFVLFTKEYDQFCNNYFGKFIHHKPTTHVEKIRYVELLNEETYRNDAKAKVEKFHEYVLDNLGKDTLYKWFIEYPKKYPTERINGLVKQMYSR